MSYVIVYNAINNIKIISAYSLLIDLRYIISKDDLTYQLNIEPKIKPLNITPLKNSM